MYRTQIYLPKNLREEINKTVLIRGQTLSEYLRQASLEQLEREKDRKFNLKKLAEEIVGSAKGLRTKDEVKQWEQQIRRDRQQEDSRIN